MSYKKKFAHVKTDYAANFAFKVMAHWKWVIRRNRRGS